MNAAPVTVSGGRRRGLAVLLPRANIGLPLMAR
jgi:hypothetical protein